VHGPDGSTPLTLSPRVQVRLLVAQVSFEALEQVLKGVHVDDTVRLARALRCARQRVAC